MQLFVYTTLSKVKDALFILFLQKVEDTVIRAKCKLMDSKSEGKEGWVTLRANANESLKRYSPLYTVLTETVLTDTFSLKGFKVHNINIILLWTKS